MRWVYTSPDDVDLAFIPFFAPLCVAPLAYPFHFPSFPVFIVMLFDPGTSPVTRMFSGRECVCVVLSPTHLSSGFVLFRFRRFISLVRGQRAAGEQADRTISLPAALTSQRASHVAVPTCPFSQRVQLLFLPVFLLT